MPAAACSHLLSVVNERFPSSSNHWPLQRVMAFVDVGFLIERARSILQSGPGDIGEVRGRALVDAVRAVVEPGGRQEFVRAYLYDSELDRKHPEYLAGGRDFVDALRVVADDYAPGG